MSFRQSSTFIFLIAAICISCSSNGNTHKNIKVKAIHAWEAGRGKSCMLMTGNPVVQGGKAGPDPKEMWCNDQKKTDPDDMAWEYIRIVTVSLDDESEKSFHDGQHFAVPLICQESSKTEMNCVFDGQK